MKKLFFFVLAGILIIPVFDSCKKNTGGVTPKPDPPKPPVETPEPIYPKKEMRGVWMATVWGLDWPQGVYSVAGQKKQYTDYLDKFKNLNINAVFVQIKGMGDAFYNSPYEPWSANITGTRGQDPGYDVLKFMIDEAHSRGIEFHAWLNPFRIATRSSTATPYPPLHPTVSADWVLNHEKWQMYNPAVPEARQRLVDIVKDLITKYEVDGVHMDDYFYPDPTSAGQMVSDQPDFQKYGAGYSKIEDFRRGNVDKMIQAVHNLIVATKPQVVFSVSPTSDFAYNKNTLYADVMNWRDWIDVIIPQIYQSSSFATRLDNWDIFNNKPALMIGHGYYLMTSSSEIMDQINQTRKKKSALGNLMYSAKYLNEKPGITAMLANLYKNPAVIPFLGRAVAAAPSTPSNARIEGTILKWTTSGSVKSVVYFFSDLKKEGSVLAITDKTEWPVIEAGNYSITAINADNQESVPTKLLQKATPTIPPNSVVKRIEF